MSDTSQGHVLTADQRTACQEIAGREPGLESRRAAALLLLDGGLSQAQTGEQTGLTRGQVRYVLTTFRKKGMALFPQEAPEAEAPAAPSTPQETPEAAPEPEAPATSEAEAATPEAKPEKKGKGKKKGGKKGKGKKKGGKKGKGKKKGGKKGKGKKKGGKKGKGKKKGGKKGKGKKKGKK